MAAIAPAASETRNSPPKLKRTTGLWMARYVETHTRQRRAGIGVITSAGSELGRSRGGPRCMSCPLEREDLE